jgi:hypothetical protein
VDEPVDERLLVGGASGDVGRDRVLQDPPLRQPRGTAERAQQIAHVRRHTNRELRIILDAFARLPSGRWTAAASGRPLLRHEAIILPEE